MNNNIARTQIALIDIVPQKYHLSSFLFEQAVAFGERKLLFDYLRGKSETNPNIDIIGLANQEDNQKHDTTGEKQQQSIQNKQTITEELKTTDTTQKRKRTEEDEVEVGFVMLVELIRQLYRCCRF